ncbi:MAG: hypothetical protein MK078_05600 [Crocinitomicaceae bacterium]|nr:hypothetical protein [Crocinitomicaceae bacterium]
MNTNKLLSTAVALGLGLTSFGQLIDEQDVTITMDLQPVLQLDMTTPNQIEFVFDEINEYYAGITQYGATILKVSSTVSWDLYAVGRSTGTNGPEFWDQQISYGTSANPNAIGDLPLSLLELRQNQPNNGALAAGGAFPDYSQAFAASTAASGGNSLYVNGGTNTPPTTNDKYIGGHAGTSGTPGQDFLPGGSYLTSAGTASDYYYSIDYRILPSLPAIFPMAHDADGVTPEDLVTVNGPGTYAEPGVYTMYVQYILLEDQ